MVYVCTTYILVGIWFRTVRNLLANGNVVCITIIISPGAAVAGQYIPVSLGTVRWCSKFIIGRS